MELLMIKNLRKL